MYKFEKSVFINRPQQEVFDFVSNPVNSPQWEGGIESSQWATDGPPGVGSMIKVVFKMGLFKMVFEPEITEWDPFNMYSYKGSMLGLQGTSIYRFEAKEDGTQLTMKAEVEGKGIARLLESMMGKNAEKEDGRSLDALKVLLETSETGQ
jgi:carbon monoxide dehydrogenase subunit G